MTKFKQAKTGFIILLLTYIYVIPAHLFRQELILWLYLSFCHCFFGTLLMMEAMARQGIEDIQKLLEE